MTLSRRSFLWQSAATAALTSVPVLDVWGATGNPLAGKGSAHHFLPLDREWLFAGKQNLAEIKPDSQNAAFPRVTLPHCVTPLSWQGWEPSAWEDVWIYRRHFTVPQQFLGFRLFLHFDRVMAGASPSVNGHALPRHLGGFLPFEYEITEYVGKGDNVLSVAVDSRWLNAPPSGSAKGPRSIDYLLPGGISGSVSLRAVPSLFLRDVFARPMDVLNANRRLDVLCQVDAAKTNLSASAHLDASLWTDGRELARASTSVRLGKTGQQIGLTLNKLEKIELWSGENPKLYDLVTTLYVDEKPLHRHRTRVGFRDARFELDGFYLNGERLQLFGLNRHELYPYVGFAASDRVLRRDAEMLRHQFNCNIVRCSHYPQSEAFLDACDELGLMVWEETPGWQYIGGEKWQDLLVRDVGEMVRRDRNHPAVVIWGVRANESANEPALYRRTRALAKSLDGTRPTSGTMTPSSRKNWRQEWHQDVFAFDDYHSAAPGVVGIEAPVQGVPYLITEAVGQFNYKAGKGFKVVYRRKADVAVQQEQALFHAQAHSKAADYPRCAGLIGWCAFDYASLLNAYDGVKYPGVADFFRLPKLGASFYLAQVDPKVRPVIEPSFYWDFGPHMPSGPGERAAIFSNCDRLELSIDGKMHAVLHPDHAGFPHLKYAPFFADLKMAGGHGSELLIRGYVNGALLLSRRFSADTSADRLWCQVDDHELYADGADATRLAFGVVDQFGAPRAFAGGEVSVKIDGPGLLVGDNPFDLTASGGLGAVWIKTVPGSTGQIRAIARHSSLGPAPELQVRVVSAE